MTPDEFDALFDGFTATVIRLETLPLYDVGEELAELSAARDGLPRPERSVRTSPWLARIAVQTIQQGKVWTRVRVVSDPPTEYESHELIAHGEAQVVGNRVLVAQRNAVEIDIDPPDFWLFDRGLPGECAVRMFYDEAGHWLGAQRCDDPAVLASLRDTLDRVLDVAVSLNEYLAAVRSG